MASYRVHRQPIPRGVRLLENVYLTMPDGVKLAMDVYLPEGDGRYPTIVAVCPYKKEAQACSPNQGFHSEGGDYRFFVPRGYAMAFVTARGAGLSQGKFCLMGEQEQRDGYHIIEGIAQQPWCDGNIGMFGGSYLGMSQYYVAAQRPPHLKCIVPCDASTDFYRDFVYQTGGMFYRAFMEFWGVILYDELMFPGPVDGKEPPPNLYYDWLSNYLDGPYYQERSMINIIDRIEVPTLAVLSGSGWLHSRGMLRGLHKMKTKHLKVMVAPCHYGLMMFSTLYWENERFLKYVLRWFDHWLKGIDTGIMDEPPVLVFDGGTLDWRYENEIPPVSRTEWTKLYLRENPERPTAVPQGLLSFVAPDGDEEPDTYKTLTPFRGRPNPTPPLAYVTPPLEKDMRVWGPVSATIFGSASGIDTSLWAWIVKVGDLAPDGSLKIITKGTLKACYREVDESKSTPQFPWHPFSRKQYLEPDKVYDFLIEILPIFHTFKAGHRVWVQIASDDPDFKPDNHSDPVPGPFPMENRVYHDAAHPSHILLPVVPDAPVIRPVEELPF